MAGPTTAAMERSDEPFARLPERAGRLADLVYGRILDRLLDGGLQEGARLPPESALCAQFGVSRPTVREALLRLRADGLLASRQGAGTFVRARPAARLRRLAEPEAVASCLRCIEVRLPLETEAAGLAAERRTAEQLAAIEAACARFSSQSHAGEATPEVDLALHAAIAEGTGNEAFRTTLATLHEQLSGFMGIALGLTRSGSPERARLVREEHEAIVAAIRAREPGEARAAMQHHVLAARGRIVDRSRDR